MSRAAKIAIWLAVVAVVCAVGWRIAYPSYEWRQKITLEVETPQGPVSASSVAEVAWWGTPTFGFAVSPRDHSVKAEAVVLRLPDGRYLFSLVSASAFIALSTLTYPPYEDDRYLDPASQVEDFEGNAREVPRGSYPMLVTFGDVADPASVMRVDPDNLAATFGPGVSLKRITLEITDEPVTEGRIEDLLKWIEQGRIDPQFNEGRSETLRYSNDSSRGYGTISVNEFVRPR